MVKGKMAGPGMMLVNGCCLWRLACFNWQYVTIGISCAGLAQESDDQQLSINLDESPVVLNIGEKRVILCNGTAQNKNWVDVKGNEVGPRGPARRVHVERLQGQILLVFDQPKNEDNGTWTCRAGNINRTIDVYIVEAVTFYDTKEMEEPEEGSNVDLPCKARGTPKPVLMWYRDNEPIATDTGKYKVSSDNRLHIYGVNRNDSGEYECKAHQKLAKAYFHVKSTKTLLQVQHMPILEHASVREIYAIVNETKNLTCAATAYPEPTYRWTRHYEEKKWDDDIKDNVFTAEDHTFSTLMLHVNSSDDLGTYNCLVSNRKGDIKITYHLQQGNKPKPLEQVIFKSAPETEANDSLVFEVTCGDCPDPIYTADQSPNAEDLPVLSYRFELKATNATEANPNWEEIEGEVIVRELERKNSTSYTVDGLRNDTSYQIRVAAVNMAGFSEFISVVGIHKTSSSIMVLASRFASIIVILSMAIIRRNVWCY